MSFLLNAARTISCNSSTTEIIRRCATQAVSSRLLHYALRVPTPVPQPPYAEHIAPEKRILTVVDLLNPPKPSGYGKPIKAAILDSAGTVQDPGVSTVIYALQRLFKNIFKIDISWYEAAANMGIRKELHLQAILFSQRVREEFFKLNHRYPTQEDADRAYQFLPQLILDTLKEAKFREPIVGLKETVANLRQMSCQILSTTGFVTGMDVFLHQALAKIYNPDIAIDASQVPMGRPDPDMVCLALAAAGIPSSHAVKIGDTKSDIEEGLRANTWTIGLSLTSVHIQKSAEQLTGLDVDEIRKLNDISIEILKQAKPHYIASGIWEVFKIVQQIDYLSRKGYHPFNFPTKDKKSEDYLPARIPE